MLDDFAEDTRSKLFAYDTASADRDDFTAGAGIGIVVTRDVQPIWTRVLTDVLRIRLLRWR